MNNSNPNFRYVYSVGINRGKWTASYPLPVATVLVFQNCTSPHTGSLWLYTAEGCYTHQLLIAFTSADVSQVSSFILAGNRNRRLTKLLFYCLLPYIGKSAPMEPGWRSIVRTRKIRHLLPGRTCSLIVSWRILFAGIGLFTFKGDPEVQRGKLHLSYTLLYITAFPVAMDNSLLTCHQFLCNNLLPPFL